ncbi:UNVERIFIED_CONTAM: uncharacterized protein (TIGR03382 family) [Streptomyces canus]
MTIAPRSAIGRRELGNLPPMNACGCGEDQIPWMLAKFGFLGSAGLILGILITMIAAGWLLSSLVWLVRRRHTPTPTPAPIDEPSQHPLAGFTWTDEPPRGA